MTVEVSPTGWFKQAFGVIKDICDEFVEKVTGGDVDLKHAPKPEWTGKGVEVEPGSNDRTQNAKNRKPIDVFLGEDENGRILNQGNAAERLNAYLIAKFGTEKIEPTPENQARAARLITNLTSCLDGNPAASAVKKAADEWIYNHFYK